MSYIKYHFSDWKGRMPSQAGYEGENDYPKQYKVTPTGNPTTYVTKGKEYKVYANIHKEVK